MGRRCSPAVSAACCVLLTVWAACASAQPLDATQRMMEWVRQLGGMAKVEVKTNPNGVRGLFATEFVKQGESLASIPASAIMNAGALNSTLAVSTLTVLRELKDPHTRFAPYLDVFDKGVLNWCNMAPKYFPMWKADYWERTLPSWQAYMGRFHQGAINADLEITIEEAVGNATVTLDDLKYACAVASTRYVTAPNRPRLVMVPIFDLCNHKLHCDHFLRSSPRGHSLEMVAGKDMQPGDEVCYSYGPMRDDYSVAYYGFLPDLESPPRLALVDHRAFDPEDKYSHDDAPAEEPFVGTPAELRAELARLKGIYSKLKATPDALPQQPKGQDYVYDLLKELEGRRLAALRYEMGRISGLLNIKAEL